MEPDQGSFMRACVVYARSYLGLGYFPYEYIYVHPERVDSLPGTLVWIALTCVRLLKSTMTALWRSTGASNGRRRMNRGIFIT
jgi:hypothetical protein